MKRRLNHLAAVIVVMSLSPQLAQAQEDEDYRFDGVADNDPQPADPTDWMTTENWSDGGSDPFGPPFGPLIPDFGTSVELTTSTFGVDAPVIGPGDTAEAFDLRIGRFAGEGLLTMTGGTLDTVNSCSASPFTCNRRLRVGAAQVSLPEDRNAGVFDLIDGVVNTDTLWIGSGSLGTMNMSGGELTARGDMSLDWTFDAGSVLNMTNGTINVGASAFAANRSLRMYRNSLLNLDGGEILVSGAAQLGLESSGISQGGVQNPNVTVSITDGLLQADDLLMVNGSVTVSGGILRADSFDEANSTGTVEINGSGLLQFNNSQESVAAVQAFVTGGIFNTSGASTLVVEIVDVDGVDFTQVAVMSAGVPGDYDGDRDVDGGDFLKWQRDDGSAAGLALWESNFGAPPSSVAANVPEPDSIVLAALAGMVLFRKPKRNCF